MILDGNLQQDAAIPDFLGDLVIGFTWLEVARRMVVSQDDACGMLSKANLEDLLRINNSPGDASLRHHNLFDYMVCFVHQCGMEAPE